MASYSMRNAAINRTLMRYGSFGDGNAVRKIIDTALQVRAEDICLNGNGNSHETIKDELIRETGRRTAHELPYGYPAARFKAVADRALFFLDEEIRSYEARNSGAPAIEKLGEEFGLQYVSRTAA